MADDDVVSIDGHVFRGADDREDYLRFIREEGTQMLSLYGSISDPDVENALLDLVKSFAKAGAAQI